PRWKPDPVSENVIKEFQRQYEMRRATATQDPGSTSTPTRTPTSISTSTSISTPNPVPAEIRTDLDCLPNLKKLVFENSCINQQGIDRLLPWIPDLETLALYGSLATRPLEFSQSLQDHCLLLSTLVLSRVGNEMYNMFMKTTCSLLLRTSLRGWKTVALIFEDPAYLCDVLESVLCQHGDSLETLFLEGCLVAGTFIHRMLCSATRLRHLVAIIGGQGGNMMYPAPIPQADWVCLDLEGFRVQFNLRRSHDLPPFAEKDLLDDAAAALLAMTNTKIAKRLCEQRELYLQIRRLTKLKGTSYRTRPCSSWYNPDLTDRQPSHAKNLASGLDLLKNLKQLRRVRLDDLEEGGFMECEEDREWVKESWPLLQKGYRDEFWIEFRR
ncbi:hypothetical protein BGX29_012134, partial [Mortierella sp. GBA35]